MTNRPALHQTSPPPSRRKSFSELQLAAENNAEVNTETPRHSDVIYKLLFFTVAMISSPLLVYFLSRDKLFNGMSHARSCLGALTLLFVSHSIILNCHCTGNATFAGVAAVVTVNLVLFAYIFVAWTDDKAFQQEERAARLAKKNT